jgi:uncharacterized protein involved in tolerance to divalent cations
MGNSVNGAHTNKRTETVTMSGFSSCFNLSENNTVNWKKRVLNSTPPDLVFKSTSNRASKALYALIKHGNSLGTVKKYFCLNEPTTSITFG